MSAAKDFRAFAFDAARVKASGAAVGRRSYSKLFAVENLVRILIHSILSAQRKLDWWDEAVDGDRRRKAEGFRSRYASKPWHGKPGVHGLYYLGLEDLNEVIRANAHQFRAIIPEIDHLMTQIELIREPRNIVCHMNWPTPTDASRIDVLLNDVEAHMARLQAAGRIPILVPK